MLIFLKKSNKEVICRFITTVCGAQGIIMSGTIPGALACKIYVPVFELSPWPRKVTLDDKINLSH